MNLLAAILTCSLYGDDALVAAIVDNVGGNPLAIVTPDRNPDTGARTTAPDTREDAGGQLQDLTRRGSRPLLGLMQVPISWALTFGREPQDLFDPCINVSIGSAMLSEYAYFCAHTNKVPLRGSPTTAAASDPTAWRPCVGRKYAEAVGMPDLSAVLALSLRYRPNRPATPNDAPIFHPQVPHAWGCDQLLMPTEPAALDPRSSQAPTPGLRMDNRSVRPASERANGTPLRAVFAANSAEGA